MSVTSKDDVIKSTEGSKNIESNNNDNKTSIPKLLVNDINLNDVLFDLKKLSQVSENLAIALSMYLDQRGELDPKRFKLVK